MKIKELVLRDQAVPFGPQLGLMAAEHRLALALIWMSTRRLVLGLSLCTAIVHCVPVNCINSMAATSSHAKVINKHPQMAHNDSLQLDVASEECQDELWQPTALFASQFTEWVLQNLLLHFHNYVH